MSKLSPHSGYSTFSAVLTESLALRRPPIAISFTDSMPEGVANFAGRVPAGCRFWEEAATSAFVTSAIDHSLCAIGVHTHNLQPSQGYQVDLGDALRVFQQLGYVREEDIPTIPVLQSQLRHVVYSPLAETPLPPDIVILFVNANQTLILSEATQQVENLNAPAMGRPACAVVPQVMNTGRAALSLGCCGARAYLDSLTDGVAIFAIPGAKLEAYTQRIQELAKANALLSKFHALRRRDITAGLTPTVSESLEALKTGNSAQ
jgi:uncharacterized protein (DUF169 family)